MNNDIIELLKLALKESDPLSLRNLLEVCQDSKLFQKPSCKVENVITFINSLLNLSSDCQNGLLILKVVLPQCKSDVIGVHLIQWLQLCIKALHSNNQSATLYELFRQLISYSTEYPDIRKQTSLTIIPKIMDYHFKESRTMSSKFEVPFLLCLEEILLNYGKACGSLKGKIEQFLLLKLEGSLDVVHLCAKCYLNLLAIGLNKEDCQELWYNKQLLLISALHEQLNNLFHSINEIQGTYDEYIIEYDRKCIPEISDKSPLHRAQRLTRLFNNLAQFLSVILLGPFPEEKSINPESIFSVICRGLSVNCTILEANITSDTLILSTQIPSIQEACVGLLDALIQCCRRELYTHGQLICKLLIQILKWTKSDKCDYGQEKPYSGLRVKAYNCFTNWLSDARKCSSAQHYINDIIINILSDVHYNKPAVTLSITSKRLKGKLGKKQRKFNQLSSNTDNTLSNVVNSEANKEVCTAALNFIPSLLEATFDLISPKYHKHLQELIINEIVTLQVADSLNQDLPIPYSDESCRYGLFKALLALCNYYHPEFTIPSNYAMSLFEVGLNDISLEVSRLCGQAVANIEKIINPIVCTLKYPLKIGEDITSLDSNQHEQINSSGRNPLDETLVGESITRLFQVKSSESDSNVVNDKSETLEKSRLDVNERIIETKSNDIIIIDDNVDEKRIQLNISHDNCKNKIDLDNESMPTKNDAISKINNETTDKKCSSVLVERDEINIDNKRLNDDDNEDDAEPLGKKKKTSLIESSQSQTVNNELENTMLSSFVDIV